MKISEVSREQFATWSVERDIAAGGFDEDPNIKSFSDLPKEEQKIYLDEADYYLTKHPKDDWPTDILVRLEAE